MNGPAPAPVQWATANGLTQEELMRGLGLPVPGGGTIAWAFGRSTNSEGVVSNLTLRNG